VPRNIQLQHLSEMCNHLSYLANKHQTPNVTPLIKLLQSPQTSLQKFATAFLFTPALSSVDHQLLFHSKSRYTQKRSLHTLPILNGSWITCSKKDDQFSISNSLSCFTMMFHSNVSISILLTTVLTSDHSCL
jgi:hypothetical protein